MKSARRIPALLAILALGLASALVRAGEHDVGAFENVAAFSAVVVSGNVNRHVLYLHPIAPAAGKAPVLVLLPYLRGRPEDMADFVEAAKLVRDFGAWVIVAQPFQGEWNYGQGATVAGPLSPTIDDVGFLAQLIAQSVAQYPLDAHRVYMAGYSNGARMTLRFACDRPALIAAAGNVARVTFSAADAKACKPDRPVPMLLIQGTADPLATRDGSSEAGIVNSLNATQTAALWAKFDGCAPAPAGSSLPDTVNEDASVHLDTFTGCAQGSEVDFYTVNGGGHTWPGTIGFTSALGITDQDIRATSVLWTFFQRFSRP